MDKKILTLVIGLTLLNLFPLINAESIGSFRVGEQFQITNFCNSGDCSYMNISSITYPNGTVLFLNKVMSQVGQGFNYSFSTDTKGAYSFDTCADPTGKYTCERDSFSVNTIGGTLTSAKAITYTIILIISLLTLVGLLWIGFLMPSKNKTDEMTGYIFALNNLKYLKYTLLGFAYMTLVWISYFVWMIAYSFLDFSFLTKVFRIGFVFLAVLTLPLFILYVYITIANLVRDTKIKDLLLRGLRVR